MGGRDEVVVEQYRKQLADARSAQQIEREGHGLAYQVGANVIQAFNPYQEVSDWDAALAFSGLGIAGEGAGMRAGGVEPP